MMVVYDKAKWQTDGGIEKGVVVCYFEYIFRWLKNHGLLSEDGLEMLEVGIDDEISLNEEMVTDKGSQFLEKYYDKLLEQSGYDINETEELLNKFYFEYLR